jgi:hypothetical protein
MFLSGKVSDIDNWDYEAVHIGEIPVAEALEDFDGKNVYACYAFDDQPITTSRIIDIAIQSAEGLVDAEFGGHYSEVTGFLWLDEDGMIGGHDIVEIFRQNVGKFGALIVQEEPIDLTLLEEDDLAGSG